MWVVSAGLEMPPALEQNSTDYAGVIPPDAVRFDQAGLAAYIRDNTPRPDPVPEPDWTEQDIKSNLGWSAAQLRTARASGFPKNTGHKNLFNEEGIPYERVLLWRPQVVRAASSNPRLKGIGWR